MANAYSARPANHSSNAKAEPSLKMERNRCQGDRGIPERSPRREDMPRKPLDKRFSDYPLLGKRCRASFPAFRRGRVWAEPRYSPMSCQFLGKIRSPGLFLMPFSHFGASFFCQMVFIVHLTLPLFVRVKISYPRRKQARIINKRNRVYGR